MITSLKKMYLSCLVAACTVTLASAANEYLPPNKGYNYPPPNVPFPSDNNGIKQPAPTYKPPPTPTRAPAYIPPPSGPAQQPDRPFSPPSTGSAYNPTHSHRPTVPSRPSGSSHHSSSGSYDHSSHDHSHDDHHHEPGMPFDFSYAVNEDDNNYSHNAISDGDVTRGEYRVALPDGRTQIVKYTADWKNGFNAEVSYEGEAKYPDQPAGGYGQGPANRPPSGPGQQYVPPSQGGGYQY